MITRRCLVSGAATVSAMLIQPAQSQGVGKIRIGYTAVLDYTAAFVAQEEGFFRRQGLETELQLIPLNSTLPAALQSNSIQIGGPTPSVMISAVDGGLDLVALTACAEITREVTTFGVVVKTGSDVQDATGFVGKRVGVPGLNAFLHVLFRKWLMDKGVDPRRVTFVEVAFPQMADVLRGGTVDAVVTGEPVLSRIVASSTGRLVSNMTPELAEPLPTALWATTRAWATRNPDAIRGFRSAIAEAVAWTGSNSDKAREYIAKYTRLPIEIVRTVPLARLRSDVTQRELEAWVRIMTEQDMLTSKIDAARLRLA
ncbi:ABC transporter substrate-binding protein [Roseomonas sp. KE2513]|uniref:ABC transporter substrate-binding protein n=1 Tax=Roseomonas sp. KE2513 TaxID=2479202 RepID=UPI0018E01A56|nr:ABC transporter substrate-binding protein [Roseomonas sp. KE2513]